MSGKGPLSEPLSQMQTPAIVPKPRDGSARAVHELSDRDLLRLARWVASVDRAVRAFRSRRAA